MPDADPYKVFTEARGRIRDAAKWIVTVLGSVIVLIIGSGLVVNIPALDPLHIFGAAACLITLTALCAYPFIGAVRILVSPFVPFHSMVTDEAFFDARVAIDQRLKARDPHDSILLLDRQRAALRTAYESATDDRARASLKTKQDEVEDRIRLLVEQISLANLEIRFTAFLTRMKWCACGVALVIPLFLFVLHKDGPVEQLLDKPNVISIALTPDAVSALTRSGLSPQCYSEVEPRFIRVSEISGVGAGVLVVPSNPADCPPVRVVLTTQNKIDVVGRP